MTEQQFRRLALSMPEAVEGAHMGHPDFRVQGRIFATLLIIDGVPSGMVKLNPDQQRAMVTGHPTMFTPIRGGWGRQGCTRVILKQARTAILKGAMLSAWLNTAPPQLVREWAGEPSAAGAAPNERVTGTLSRRRAPRRRVTGGPRRATRRSSSKP